MKGDGTTTADQLTRSRPTRATTVHPADMLGTGNDAAHDFSTKVESHQRAAA